MAPLGPALNNRRTRRRTRRRTGGVRRSDEGVSGRQAATTPRRSARGADALPGRLRARSWSGRRRRFAGQPGRRRCTSGQGPPRPGGLMCCNRSGDGRDDQDGGLDVDDQRQGRGRCRSFTQSCRRPAGHTGPSLASAAGGRPRQDAFSQDRRRGQVHERSAGQVLTHRLSET